MSNNDQIKKHSNVIANRDLSDKGINKGDLGIVTEIQCIDSDEYLNIKLNKGNYVFTSSVNCWNLIKV